MQQLIQCKSEPSLFSCAFVEFEKYELLWPTVQPHTGEMIFGVTRWCLGLLMPTQETRRPHSKNIQLPCHSLPQHNKYSQWTVREHLIQLMSSQCLSLTEHLSRITQISARASSASTNTYSFHSSLAVDQWMQCNGYDISPQIQIHKDTSAGAVNF